MLALVCKVVKEYRIREKVGFFFLNNTFVNDVAVDRVVSSLYPDLSEKQRNTARKWRNQLQGQENTAEEMGRQVGHAQHVRSRQTKGCCSCMRGYTGRKSPFTQIRTLSFVPGRATRNQLLINDRLDFRRLLGERGSFQTHVVSKKGWYIIVSNADL